VQQVTRTIPIVTSNGGDLVQGGLAASLARPGGNVTRVQTLMSEVTGKHLALLKEVVSGLSRSGVLMGELGASEAETSGKTLGVRLQFVGVHRTEDLDAAFSAFRAERAQGVLVVRSNFSFTHRSSTADLALKHRTPTISDLEGFVGDGGLVSYGYDGREANRLFVETIDKILPGAKASETPIKQVTTFQLVINPMTAKALGPTIPQSLLSRADEVIQ
jgi:putative ABC transport system substrate-binding protein